MSHGLLGPDSAQEGRATSEGGGMLRLLGRLSALLFAPLRRLTGPLHRRRPALSDEQEERQTNLPPLPPPWSDDERWYRGDFPPRENVRIRPLIHGAEYFPDLHRELLSARSRVTIAGWALSPHFSLLRGDDAQSSTIERVLDEVSSHAEVYVLLWAGAPALFQPNTHSVEQVRDRLLTVAPRVHCALDRTAPFSHDHHQKAVTVDGRVAYVGGMDISSFQGDRWDTAHHPIRFGVGWHDIQARVEGPLIRDVEENFWGRWEGATGERLQPHDPIAHSDDGSPAQLVRTIPRDCYPSMAPDGHYGIRHALLAALGRARSSIYLENQYLWAPEVVEALCVAMDRNGPHFRIVVVLPARAYDGRYDNDDHVRHLAKHDEGRGRFAAYSLYSSGPAESVGGYRYLPIYVHAKVSIVDDEWFMIGSANLNRRGLATDSEIAVHSVDPTTARELRVRLWAEHLGLPESEMAAVSIPEAVDRLWRERAAEVERGRRESLPGIAHHAHPYETGGTPAARLMDRFQSATLEH